MSAGWQTIATAPDDGTPVLVIRPTTGGPETLIAYCVDEERKEWCEYWGGEKFDGPTHWMPLPEPPSAAASPTDITALRDEGGY